MADRVRNARLRAGQRYAGLPWTLNAQVPGTELRRDWRPDLAGQQILEQLTDSRMSLRGIDRVLRLAWTVADLAGVDRPGADQVAIAAGLRAQEA